MLVEGHGKNSDIMLVGDFATDDDFTNGKALTGYSETILKSLFAGHNYKLDNTYRTLYIKDRLSYNGRAKKKKDEAITEALGKADWKKILIDEITELRPTVITPLGNLSLKFLSGHHSVDKFRGSVLPLNPEIQSKLGEHHIVKVIPTLSPFILNADWVARIYCSLDIQKVVLNKDNRAPIRQRELIWIAKNAQELRTYINRIRDCDFITLDIETYCGIPTCIGFSHDGYEGVCVPLLDTSIDMANRVLMWQMVSKLLYSHIPKVNQNIKYDQTILERFNFKVQNIVFDTQVAAGLIYPELDKNLGFLASIYTDMPYFKNEGKEFDASIHDKSRLYIYNAKDAISTYQVARKQKEEILELGMRDLYYGNNPAPEKEPELNPLGLIKLYHIYQKMDKRGIQIDAQERDKLISKYGTLLQIYETILRNKIDQPDFNVNSPKQVGILVYESLKYPIRKKTNASGSSYNTEEDMLEELYLNHKPGIAGDHEKYAEVLELIIFVRKLYKILQTINTTIHPDLRMRQASNLSGTSTGRTSGNKALDELFVIDVKRKSLGVERKRVGHSLQTLGKHGFPFQGKTYGKDLRTMFVPSPGKVLVEIDFSQAEARVDAVLAADYDMLPVFDNGIGIHRLTGSWVYSCEPSDIKKGTEEYHIAKIVRHAAERNMKPPLLSLLIHKPIAFATELLTKFHTVQPKIRAIFHQDVTTHVRQHRNLVAPNSRRRDFFGRPNEQMFNEAISFLPQCIVSDQNKFTMIPFYEDNNEFPWLAEMHDATLCELDKSEVESYCMRYKKIAERPINFLNCSLSRDFELVIPAEFSISETNWQEMEEFKI
jgi:DNA polymerase I-like protein with 3'-5' exonuclease and polymerase domains/uracil-DNA glycosylase